LAAASYRLLRLIAILFIFCGASESEDSPTVVITELLHNQIAKFFQITKFGREKF